MGVYGESVSYLSPHLPQTHTPACDLLKHYYLSRRLFLKSGFPKTRMRKGLYPPPHLQLKPLIQEVRVNRPFVSLSQNGCTDCLEDNT